MAAGLAQKSLLKEALSRPFGMLRLLVPWSHKKGEWASGGWIMATITKKELVNRISAKTGQTKVVTKQVIQMFLDEIIDELGMGNRLEFREFGVFEIKERAARKAQNPRTLQKVEVPAKRVVKFKVGRMMKERVSKGMDDVHAADSHAAHDSADSGSMRSAADSNSMSESDRPSFG